MSQIQASTSIQQVKPDEVPRFVDIFFQEVIRVVNGGLDFQTNFNCKLLIAAFPAANTQVAVSHGLGRNPAGYIVTSISANIVIFNGSTPSNASTLYLQSSGAGSAGLLIY